MFKRGSVWWLRYHQNGRQVRISTRENLKEKAELVRDALEVKLFEDPWFNPRQQCELTLDEFAPRFLEWSKQNKRAYRRDCVLMRNLRAHFGRMLLDRINSGDVEAYKRRRISGDLLFGDRPRIPSKATVNRELSRLRRVLNLAVEWGELSENPLAGKLRLFREGEGRVRYLMPAEAELLLSKCSDHLRPVVHLAMLTGMRKSEIVSLCWTELDLTRGVIRLPGDRTKNGRARVIPLSGQARAVLREREKERLDGCPLVFWREPLRRRDCKTVQEWEGLGNIRKGFEGACRRAKLKDLHFHDLRHHFASTLAQAGIPLQAVGELLGHRTLAMTQRYAHLSPQVLQCAVEQAASYLGHDQKSECSGAPLAAVLGVRTL